MRIAPRWLSTLPAIRKQARSFPRRAGCVPGRGKSGGARVIYYYHNESIPLYALDIYAKNQKANLSAAEKNAARKTVAAIVAEHNRRK